jgi:hypothetical protein
VASSSSSRSRQSSSSWATEELGEHVGVEVGELAAGDRGGDEGAGAGLARLLVGGGLVVEAEQGWAVDQGDPADLLIHCGVQVGVGHGHELVDRRCVRVTGLQGTGLGFSLDLGVDGTEQGFLGGEVVVDRAFGDPRRFGDFLDGRLRVALLAERGAGGGQHGTPGGLGVFGAERARRGAAAGFRCWSPGHWASMAPDRDRPRSGRHG